MKKLISVVIVIIMLCPMLVGCGNSENKKQVNTNKLTLYVDEYLLYRIDDALKAYRGKYPKVEIELVNMSELSKEEYQTKMRSEMLAGKGPDVIFTPDNVDIPYILTTQSILDETGIDINKADSYLEFAKKINQYLEKGDIKSHAFVEEYEIKQLFRCYGDVFVDYDKSTINLDRNELKDALSIYKNFVKIEIGNRPPPEMVYAHSHDGYNNLINKAKIFEYYNGAINLFFLNTSMLKAAGENPVMIPIRGFDGKLHSSVSLSAGISRKSKNKENAFNFIKMMLSSKIQQDEKLVYGLPVRNDSVDVTLDNLNSDIKSMADTDENVVFAELPEEDYTQYKEAVNEMESCRFLDYYSQSVLIQYMRPFFSDEKSYEECLKAAKSAFEIYVSE